MADNYLERKMEDYRKGKSQHYTPRLTPAGRRPGLICIAIQPRNLLIACHWGETLPALTRLLTEAGCRVCIMCDHPVHGSSLAQKYAALYHPGSPDSAADILKAIATLQQRWGSLATVVTTADVACDLAKADATAYNVKSIYADANPQRVIYHTLADIISTD